MAVSGTPGLPEGRAERERVAGCRPRARSSSAGDLRGVWKRSPHENGCPPTSNGSRVDDTGRETVDGSDPGLATPQSHLLGLAPRLQMAGVSAWRLRSTSPRITLSVCSTAPGRQGRPGATALPKPPGLSSAPVRGVFILHDAANGELVYWSIEEVSVLPLPKVPASESGKAEPRRFVHRPPIRITA